MSLYKLMRRFRVLCKKYDINYSANYDSGTDCLTLTMKDDSDQRIKKMLFLNEVWSMKDPAEYVETIFKGMLTEISELAKWHKNNLFMLRKYDR